MAPPNRNAARIQGVSGVKALMTTAALAATVAGWATLSAQNQSSAATTQPTEVDIDAPRVVTATPPAWLLEAPQIATLPAVATVQPVGNAPAIAIQPQHPVSAPASTAAPPVATAAPAPALREVTAPVQPTARPTAAPPSRPATTTRSSR